MSARAAALLARGGIVLGDKVALIGQGAYADAFVEQMRTTGVQILAAPASSLVAAHGRARITGVSLRDGPVGTASPKRHRVDAVVIDVPGAPSFELAQQAGAAIRFSASAGGYAPVTNARGRAANALWCTGDLLGTAAESRDDFEARAEAIAQDVEELLSNRLGPYLASSGLSLDEPSEHG
jgi:hypothetical protein